MEKGFVYIKDQETLEKESKRWDKDMGIDLECENNLHHYGTYISLIQLSDGEENWIVDALEIKDMSPVIKLFEDHSRQKIFHDVSFDLRIINHQYGCNVKNIYDTQLASQFAGIKELGLGNLLEMFFDVKKKKQFQKADWTMRPLTQDMLAYAAQDTRYLLRLRDILNKRLKDLGRLSWLEEENKHLEEMDFEYKEGGFWDMKGLGDLDEKEIGLLKILYELRDQFAKKVNRPFHFIMPNRLLVKLAKEGIGSSKKIADLRGVHPIIKRNADLIFMKAKEAKPLKFNHKPRKRLDPLQRKRHENLNIARESLSEKFKIDAHLILSKDQMLDLVLGNNRVLRDWQKDMIVSEFKKKKAEIFF